MIQKYTIYHIIFLLLPCLWCNLLQSQITKAVSFNPVVKNMPVLNLEELNMHYLDSVSPVLKQPLQKTAFVAVDLSLTDFTKLESRNGYVQYSLGFQYGHARAISFTFFPYRIHQGVEIIFTDNRGNVLLGALGSHNNKNSTRLPTEFLSANEVYLHVMVPDTLKNIGLFGIQKIYINSWEENNRNAGRDICFNDINCFSFKVPAYAKNAVCRIKTFGYKDCSGVLVNNSNSDGQPFLLTANHCISNQNEADESVFTFRDERPVCGCHVLYTTKSIAGAEFLTGSKSRDFSLLKLSIKPDSTFMPVYLGINLENKAYPNVTCIHQMNGLDKKIAVELNTIYQSTFDEVVDYFEENGHWKIEQWDVGTTGGGSSGAPLLDDEGYVIGLLSGGQANCNKARNDYFATLINAWEYVDTLNGGLKKWLDPQGVVKTKLSSFQPYAFAKNGMNYGCDTTLLPGDDVFVYPNPFNHQIALFCDVQTSMEIQIHVFDITGRNVKRMTLIIHPGDNLLDLSDLKNGVYFIRIPEKGKSFKVLKTE